MRGALVLRPEPGNAETAACLDAAGIDVLRQPLFAIAPVAWQAPDPTGFDALLLTSANAARHAGVGLRALSRLPVLAVGAATATAAQAAGLKVEMTGDQDAATLVVEARARGYGRLLHLAGRDRIAVPLVDAITVYRSDALPVTRADIRNWHGRVALLHSVRAARRFASLVDRDIPGSIAIAALSPAIAEAAGSGWASVAVADRPTDAALVALIDPVRRAVDKPVQ